MDVSIDRESVRERKREREKERKREREKERKRERESDIYIYVVMADIYFKGGPASPKTEGVEQQTRMIS